jgi:integrase/recombinase XerC
VIMFIRIPPRPKTLSPEEEARLLEVVAQRGCRRDLAILTLALTTGLRLRELVGLNVGDVTTRSGEVAWKVDLPKKITKGRRGGVAFLSERARAVLRDFLETKRVKRESTALTAPLFRSSYTRRLSLRRVQVIFARWQLEAGFDAHYNFHTLRHTAITNVYRATKDLFLTQRFARHASPVTTVAYTHPSDEELYAQIGRL